ncbi:uncharacterized protein LOC128250269 isoform X2 [Octopus bimaculoides]|uniref:uncharacterized protein LOC128250269 isoform X2 n=1 Tax=Octopus bimaculoides TaxID=37653 RepID=UPI0022DFBAC2|nr:uncharacterized protein LOC128250269 isoform X2 [Octopus bimaculoides]
MLKSTGKCVLMSTMLSALISLLMDNRESIYVVEMTPAEGIEVGKTINISITCLLVLKNLLDFKLQQNGNTVVHIQYSRIIHGYRKLNTSNGFDCDLPVANIDYITCWKHKPTCNDVAAYSCKTFNAVSKKKVFKAKSTLESLQIAEGFDEQGRKVKHFRCVATIGAPFQSGGTFVWMVSNHNGAFDIFTPEDITRTSSCYSLTSTYYIFIPPAKDVTNISCTTKFGSFDLQISDEISILKKR